MSTKKFSVDNSYAQLLPLATRMAEVLSILRNSDDLAKKFKDKMRAEADALLEQFAHVSPQFADVSARLRLMENGDGDYLVFQASGSGPLMVRWKDANNNPLSRRATLEEAREAVRQSAASGSKKVDDWVLVEDHGRVMLLPPVMRVGSNFLKHGQTIYSYDPALAEENIPHMEYQFRTHISPLPYEQSVDHPDTRRALITFLDYEEHYPVAVREGESVFTRSGNAEAIIGTINGNAIYVTEAQDETVIKSKEFFDRFHVPRIEQENTALKEKYQNEWEKARRPSRQLLSGDDSAPSLG